MNNINKFKSLCIAAVAMLICFGAQAQKTEISIYANGTLPVAQFNNAVELTNAEGLFVPMDRSNIATGATPGLGFTGRFGVWFDLGMGQLLPYAEASFLWNNSKAKIRNLYEDNTRNSEYGERPNAPVYFNIPMMLGLKYRYNLMPSLSPYAEFGIGYDLLFINRNGYRNVQDKKYLYTYKPSGEVCWSIGAGAYLGEFVSVGLYYMGLGNHHIDYTKTFIERHDQEEGNADYSNAERRNLGELGLRVGFHF